jgi:hypothetical protein
MHTEFYWTELLEDRDGVGRITLRYYRNKLLRMINGHSVLRFMSCGMPWC